MDTLIVFVVIALAAGFLIRRFFFKKGNSCGCGCPSGGCSGGNRSSTCCTDASKHL